MRIALRQQLLKRIVRPLLGFNNQAAIISWSCPLRSFIAKIECADRLMSRLEFEDALKICEETEKEWYDNAKLIDTMLIHDYVDNIGLSISRMTAFAQKQNRDMYFAESVQAKKELASIKESEFPLVENIL